MVEHWKKLRDELLADYRIMQVLQDHSRSRRTGTLLSCAEMVDWINVVSLTVPGRVVMIRQVMWVMEIPGRVIDHGEGPVAARVGNCVKKPATGPGRSRR